MGTRTTFHKLINFGDVIELPVRFLIIIISVLINVH